MFPAQHGIALPSPALHAVHPSNQMLLQVILPHKDNDNTQEVVNIYVGGRKVINKVMEM